MRWTGARVLDPVEGTYSERTVHVVDGRIAAAGGGDEVDCAGMVLAPAFVDLHGALCNVRLDGAAAVSGGFATVLMSVEHPTVVDTVAAVRDALHRAANEAPCEVLVPGALTRGLRGEELSEMGLMLDAGAVALTQGSALLGGAQVLRQVFEYASRFDRPIFLRAGDAALERGGLVKEGPSSVRSGLPGLPAASEELGVHRIASLARLTGARVHITHLWSALGVQAVRRLRVEGLALTASTTAHHLSLDGDALGYSGQRRFVPPLGDANDRAALVGGLLDGTLAAVATDHRPLAPHQKDCELDQAAPGAVGFETAFAQVLNALGGDVLATVRVLCTGPRAVLGLPEARLAVGERAQLVALRPTAELVVDDALRGSRRNTPLRGHTLRGVVARCSVGS